MWSENEVLIYRLSLNIKSDVDIVLPKSSQKVKKVGRESVEYLQWSSQKNVNVSIHFRDVPYSFWWQLVTLALSQKGLCRGSRLLMGYHSACLRNTTLKFTRYYSCDKT